MVTDEKQFDDRFQSIRPLPRIRVFVPAGWEAGYQPDTGREGLVGFQSLYSTSVQSECTLNRTGYQSHCLPHTQCHLWDTAGFSSWPGFQEWRSDPAYKSWRHTDLLVPEVNICQVSYKGLFCIEASTVSVLIFTQNDTRSTGQSDTRRTCRFLRKLKAF